MKPRYPGYKRCHLALERSFQVFAVSVRQGASFVELFMQSVGVTYKTGLACHHRSQDMQYALQRWNQQDNNELWQ